MDKSKRDIYFYNLLGIKWHMHADGRKCSSKWSTKTTKCSGWTCYKGGGSHGLCPVAFLTGVYEPMDSDINIGKDNEIFSSRRRLKAYISVNMRKV